MPFDFEADRRLAHMQGYEPAGSSIPMLERCAQHQQAGGVNHWDLVAVMSHESAPVASGECLPAEESGRPDVRPLADDPTLSGG